MVKKIWSSARTRFDMGLCPVTACSPYICISMSISHSTKTQPLTGYNIANAHTRNNPIFHQRTEKAVQLHTACATLTKRSRNSLRQLKHHWPPHNTEMIPSHHITPNPRIWKQVIPATSIIAGTRIHDPVPGFATGRGRSCMRGLR